MKVASLDLVIAAQVFAFTLSANVTLLLLRFFQPSVEKCLASTGFMYYLLVPTSGDSGGEISGDIDFDSAVPASERLLAVLFELAVMRAMNK